MVIMLKPMTQGVVFQKIAIPTTAHHHRNANPS